MILFGVSYAVLIAALNNNRVSEADVLLLTDKKYGAGLGN